MIWSGLKKDSRPGLSHHLRRDEVFRMKAYLWPSLQPQLQIYWQYWGLHLACNRCKAQGRRFQGEQVKIHEL